MKSSGIGSHRLKVETRPPLHRRRGSSKSDPTFSASDSEQSLDRSKNMASSAAENTSNDVVDTSVDTDTCMTLEKLNVKQEDSKETKQLKELLLVHLDLITQQQELLLAKERQVRNLKSEKDALKCRLERMERRMSLLRQKGSTEPISIETRIPQSAPPAHRSQEGAGKGQKRKGSLEPQSLAKRFASGTPTTSTASIGRGTSVKEERVSHHTPRKHQKHSNRSQFGTRYFSRTPLRPGDSSAANDSDSTTKTLSPPRRKKVDDEPERDILDRVKERLHPVFPPQDEKSEYFERTNTPYYVPWEIPICPYQRISPKKKNETLLVPNFRVRQIPTGYSMEGTENLDDEIFAKRHTKPELEEKRRKRWDIQRMREQRLYEKLQGKQKKEKSQQEVEPPPESFLPDPDDVRYIEICDNVPVSAFGYPVPHINNIDFILPEFDMDKREREENKKSSARKKR